MRQSRAQKEQSRQRIVECAAKAIRTQGLAGTGIAPLMAEAGMTHGGFYRHFKSKDELLEVALGEAFTQANADLLAEPGEGNTAERLDALLARYVSDHHIRDIAAGCPLPGTGADVSRGGPGIKSAYSRSVLRAIDAIAGDEKDQLSSRAAAAQEFAKMVGAVLIARACDEAGATEFLDMFRYRVERDT